METLSFNEWMAYIHRELNYPEVKIKEYEKSIGYKASVSCNKQRTNGIVKPRTISEKQDNSTPSDN